MEQQNEQPPVVVMSKGPRHSYTTINIGATNQPATDGDGDEWGGTSITLRDCAGVAAVAAAIEGAGLTDSVTDGEWRAVAEAFGAGYGEMVAALVAARYPADRMQAIINNHLLADGDAEHEAEYAQMQQDRKAFKAVAKRISISPDTHSPTPALPQGEGEPCG